MKTVYKIFFFYSICLFQSPNVSADSFYSSLGLGMPHYFVSPKAVGMGGAGLGVQDPLTVNTLNPATLSINGVTTLAIDFDYEIVKNQTADNKVITKQGMPSGFRFIIPLKSKLNLITALTPLTTSKYVLSVQQNEAGTTENRLIRGAGGLTAAGLGLHYIINPWLSLGAIANFNFGSYEEEWKIDFESSKYFDYSDKISSHLWGVNYDLGILIKPQKNLNFGFCYKSEYRLDLQSQTVLGSGLKYDTEKTRVTYPSAIGMGFSIPIQKITVALDYFYQPWSDYKIDKIDAEPLKDFHRIGGGVEYLVTKSSLERYYRRVSYRIGAYYAQLPFTNLNGNVLTEKFITFGVGLPFHFNAGRVDFSMEFGKRGSLDHFDYQETILRFRGSITSGELWFQRGHP
jgi:hypothetical protein